MADQDQQQRPAPRSKAEMLERLIGPSRQHDEEDLEFWRNASDEVRGRTLYKLRTRGRAIRAAIGTFFEDMPPTFIVKSSKKAIDHDREHP